MRFALLSRYHCINSGQPVKASKNGEYMAYMAMPPIEDLALSRYRQTVGFAYGQ